MFVCVASFSAYIAFTEGTYILSTHAQGADPTWGIRICIFLGEAQMEYNIIFQRIFNDIPFIGSRIFHIMA